MANRKPRDPDELYSESGGRPRPWRKKLADGWLTLCGKFPSLNAAQQQFLDSTAAWTGYGGSPNCGKTVAMICVIIRDGMTKPGNRGALIRKELSAAERGVIEDIKDYIAELNAEFKFGIAFKNDASTPRIEFPTGAVCLIFGGKDITRIQGANFNDIYIEEATQLDQEQIGMINRTRRGKTFTRIERIDAIRSRIWWVSNACEGWFKDNIVVPWEEGKLEEAGWEVGECLFVRGRLIDNKVNLDANKKGGSDYLANLKRDYGVEEALRMADGSWSLGTGNVWRPLVDTGPGRDVISMVEFRDLFGLVAPGEMIYFGMDHGIVDPTAILFFCIRRRKSDGQAVAIVFNEHYEPIGDRPHTYLAERFWEGMAPTRNHMGWWDCRMKHGINQQGNRDIDARTQLLRCGINGRNAATNKVAGIQAVAHLLTCHRLLFVRETTVNVRRELAGYRRAGTLARPTDNPCLPAHNCKNDHACDGLRYGASGLVGLGILPVDFDIGGLDGESREHRNERIGMKPLGEPAPPYRALTYSGNGRIGVERSDVPSTYTGRDAFGAPSITASRFRHGL